MNMEPKPKDFTCCVTLSLRTRWSSRNVENKRSLIKKATRLGYKTSASSQCVQPACHLIKDPLFLFFLFTMSFETLKEFQVISIPTVNVTGAYF